MSPASSSSVAGCRKTGLQRRRPAAHEHDERDRAAATGAAGRTPSRSRTRHGHHTMCPMRSTCCGLPPGLASKRSVTTPSRITRIGVAEADRLLQRVGGQDHADALGRHGADQLVDLLLGADVEAAGRMVEDQDARPRRSATWPSTTFCWLPPERLRQSVSIAGRADAAAARPSPAASRRSSPASIRPWRRELGEARQRHVLGDREEQHQPLDACARAGRSRCRASTASAGRGEAHRLPRPSACRHRAARSRRACASAPRGRSR